MSTNLPQGRDFLTASAHAPVTLPGSIQPHGLLLAIDPQTLTVGIASANAAELLGRPGRAVLGATLEELGQTLHGAVRMLAETDRLDEPVPLRVPLDARATLLEGTVHRAGPWLVVQLERVEAGLRNAAAAASLSRCLNDAVRDFSAASSIDALCRDLVARAQELTGHDRVAIHHLEPHGPGTLMAERIAGALGKLRDHTAGEPGEAELAHAAAERPRMRMLVDTRAAQVALLALPGVAALDLSGCVLRAATSRHIERLEALGARAALVVPLVREGRAWGHIACHHALPRRVADTVRSALELLAEVAATRIAAIENYTRAHVAAEVRAFEQCLIEAAGVDGDWRQVLPRHPDALLRPLKASGAALILDGEVLSCGLTPPPEDLQLIASRLRPRRAGSPTLVPFDALSADPPALALAVTLSAAPSDCLLWFRDGCGGADAPAWSAADMAMAKAFGDAVVDMAVQVNAVRLLIAEHQLAEVRATVASSAEAVVIVDAMGRACHSNAAFLRLAGLEEGQCTHTGELGQCFDEPDSVRELIHSLRTEQAPWRGELCMNVPGRGPVPVGMRAEPVPARNGALLGLILIFEDLTDAKRADAARRRLQEVLSKAGRGQDDTLMSAVLANASLAAMDITDGGAAPAQPHLLEELERSTQRAAALCQRIQRLADDA